MKHTKTDNRYWGSQAPPKSKAEFFNAVTTPAPTGDGSIATIRLYGPIDSWGGWWGVSAQDMSEVLDALPESVTQILLRINSPGGEVFEGISILNLLRAHRAAVTAVVDGLAASAASVVAAGADELVMSPGTQVMIHSPSVFTAGNAADLRKMSEVLDGIEASLVEIYEAKAGAKDWAALLSEETWWTATQAVDEGLADRVAVMPDAGETSTAGVPEEDDAGDDPTVIVVTDRVATASLAAASSHKLPRSTEPGDPNRKEEAMAYGDLTAGLRERLGVTDAAADDETLLAALDEALAEQPEPNENAPAAAAVPDGFTVIDRAVLDELQANAARGAEARAEQERTRRDGIVATALREGRIAAASKDAIRAQLDKDEEGTSQFLATLPKSSAVPVAEVGHSDTLTSVDDSLYAKAWGTDEKGA